MLQQAQPQVLSLAEAVALVQGRVHGALSDTRLSDLCVNSKEAHAGMLFIALRGVGTHGAHFARQALLSGTRVFLSDFEGAQIILETAHAREDLDILDKITVIEVSDPRQALSLLAAKFYPDMPKTIVAVTGTNGKTSTASFTRQIWENLGISAINLGTAGIEGAFEMALSHTTPEPVTLHRLLCALAKSGVTHVAMEASSHGLDQHRLDHVRLCAAGFTNLSRDHLDYHTGLGAYFAAKARLFENVLPKDGVAVIHTDEVFAQAMQVIAASQSLSVITVGEDEGVQIRLLKQRFREDGQDITIAINGRSYTTRLGLIGKFQAQNLLVALGLVLADKALDVDAVMATLPKIKSVRGRMQFAAKKENGAMIYVDYAHTPDALETALLALRPHALGRLIVVFGAGGDRDQGKRPLMGGVAREHADIAIVTDDNPRSENPASIRAQIIGTHADLIEIDDRARAILYAVDIAQSGDVVLIAGKGHEQGQKIGDQLIPFDDVEQASLSVAVLEGREL